MRTSAKKRKEANDADYCRYHGWEVGTFLDLDGKIYRITAIGEEAILVRSGVGRDQAEKRWVHTLLDNEVFVKPAQFRLRSEKR